LTQPLHEKSLYNYRQYLCLGGMPEVISNYIENDKDLIKVNKLIADNIIQAYLSDMSKYVDNKSESVKIEQIFNSVPLQLANESKKFQYLKVAPNARSRDYESGLNWLIASSLLLSSNNIPKPDYPIAAYKDSQFFKVFLSDVGLLANLLSISFSDIISNQKFSFKGSITENYVAQELIAKSIPLYYWKSNNLAEVDFLIEYPISQEGIIPIEVKSDIHTQSKSLNIYSQKFNPKYSIRISSKNFGFENGIKSVPLYAVFCIEKSLI
jgi:predicted AAA+ superfamily ATPase